MEYREHPPPPALARWVACTWERCDGGGGPVRVLPDGCIDIVWTQGAGATVVGANSTAFVVAMPARTHVVGVRMRTGAAPPLLGVDGLALLDARVALEELWGDDARRLVGRLEVGDECARRALLGALAPRAAAAGAPDALVPAAVGRLRSERAPRVRAPAGELGVSEWAVHRRCTRDPGRRSPPCGVLDPRKADAFLRICVLAWRRRHPGVSSTTSMDDPLRQLRRRVADAVGYGPTRLARVLRLERALAAARGGEELARVAAGAGYADQAHFAGDCRELAGVSPTALLG